MKELLLGNDCKTGLAIHIPKGAFQTHFHLIGGTGKGKTTAIHTMLHPLLRDHLEKPCIVIFDRMGNLSYELLLWMASRYCPAHVRARLVYIEPANENIVLGFNPLLHDTQAHGYFKVARATDIILRAWESVNIEAMPRLARWTFNAFWAAAQLGLTIADCAHFLMPWSDYHKPLLACLPDQLRYEWAELIDSRSSEVIRILESTRNRLKPYFESDILRRMFGSTGSRLDILRFMREGRIVVLNLAPQNRLSPQLADAIGALVLNEILATARSLPRHMHYPTYLLLDEFQNFVGPDIESALPEVRQLGIRLILAHQSLTQLKRGDYDLTTMIFQAQSRMIFGLQGEDADLLAHELASIKFDPNRIKDEVYSRRQLVTGHRITELASWSNSETQAQNWNKTYGTGWGRNEQVTRGILRDVRSAGTSRQENESEGTGGSSGFSHAEGGHEQLVPVYEQFLERASRTYVSFDEQRQIWARDVRNLRTGTCLLRLVDNPEIYEVNVKLSKAGHLVWDPAMLNRRYPKALDDYQRMIEDNFRSDLFVTPQTIDAETQKRLGAVLHPRITIHPASALPAPAASSPGSNPFN